MDFGIAGRVALVAGASQGIGRAVAMELARDGADVVLLARDRDKLEAVSEAVRALGRRSAVVAVDVADQRLLRDELTNVLAGFRAPTTLVLAVAAMWAPQKLQFVSDDETARLFRTDVGSAVDLCRMLLPGMVEARFGRIVALGSVAARSGVSGGTLYALSKAALEGLMRGIALDDSRRGVTANTVAVSFADTERLKARTAGDEAARERLVRATATRRLPTPEDSASVVTFLCSTRAAAITGAVVDATAGAHLNNLW